MQRNISQEVRGAVLRPKYLFLSKDIVAGTEFHFNGTEMRTYGVDKKPLQVFFYKDLKGNEYTFSHFDILSFRVNEKKMSEVLSAFNSSADMVVADKFTVLSNDIRVNEDGQEMRPLFAYKGFTFYKQQIRNGIPKDTALANLLISGHKDGYADVYYRALNIDRPVLEVIE